MKTIVLIFVSLIGACGVGDNRGAVHLSSLCGDENFKHKSEVEIAALSPDERMDLVVLEQMFHSGALNDENEKLLHSYLVEDGVRIIPRAVEYMEAYDRKTSDCRERDEARLLMCKHPLK